MLALLGACGSDAEQAAPIDTSTDTVVSAPSVPAEPEGWKEVSADERSAGYADRWWAVSGCCLSGFSATSGSPEMVMEGPLTDGRYTAWLVDYDPSGVGTVTLRVNPLRDCSLPEMQTSDVCWGTTEPGVRFEPGGPWRNIEVPLDDSFWVMNFSNAEDPATGTGIVLRTMFGKGPDFRALLERVKKDFDTLIDPLVAAGKTGDEIAVELGVDGSPFGVSTNESGYGIARWWREGFPPLSYWEGMSADIVNPWAYDPKTDDYTTATFERFITRGGSLDVRDGVMAFAYAWEFQGG